MAHLQPGQPLHDQNNQLDFVDILYQKNGCNELDTKIPQILHPPILILIVRILVAYDFETMLSGYSTVGSDICAIKHRCKVRQRVVYIAYCPLEISFGIHGIVDTQCTIKYVW